MTKKQDETLRKLEGLQTIKTVQKTLNIERQSALNLISKLKKQHHVTYFAKGKNPIYRITMRRQLPRKPGMWDIINKYSPHMKLAPWYDHQVHGKYTVEDALIDAIQKKSFRIILASLHLYKHITNWPKLYKLAKQHDCWQQVGALHDVAKMYMKVRRMPRRYEKRIKGRIKYLIGNYKTTEGMFIPIYKKWGVNVPFRIGDLQKTVAL